MAQRFLIYAINGNGLGHVARSLAIATRLRERMPDAGFLFLTSCEDPAPIWRAGFLSVKMPSTDARSIADLDRDEFLRIVTIGTAAVFAEYRPTVLIADTVPQGNVQELRPQLARPMRKILLLRACPFLNAWKGYLDHVAMYDHLIIPYEREDEVEYPGDLAARGAWVGRITICSPEALLSRADARARLGLPAEGRAVLVSFGGGGSEEVKERLKLALEVAARHPEILFAVLRPPLGRFPLPALACGNVHLISHFPIMECFHAFDVALCTSGTNMVGELIQAGLPMVWMPLSKVSVDQFPNAVRCVRRGIGLLPRLEPEPVAGAIGALLDPARREAMRRRMAIVRRPNGADVAVDLIARWCAGPLPTASGRHRQDAAAVRPVPDAAGGRTPS